MTLEYIDWQIGPNSILGIRGYIENYPCPPLKRD